MSLRIIGPRHISPSSAAKFVMCERRWWWHYEGGLREGATEALAMGGGFAAALEFQSLDLGLTEYRLRRPVNDGWSDPDGYALAGLLAERQITRAFEGYRLRWPDALDVTREVTYLTDFPSFPNEGRMLQVRVDGVAEDHLIEDKLRSGTAMRAEALENEVRQGRQLTAEIYVHWRDTGRLVPVHLRCMKKCDPRKLKKVTHDEAAAAIDLHFEQEATFVELIAHRTREQLDAFEREIAGLASRMDGMDDDEPDGARNTDSCHAYGRACPALANCQGQETDAETLARVAPR